MIFLLINLVLIFPGHFNSLMHPLHLSVCNIELNGTENTISVKLFRDDLSQVLRNNYQADISKDNTGVSQNIDLISKYINSCLQVSTDKRKNLSLYFEKSELNDDAIWLYYKLDDTVNTEKIKICNTLLLDLWDDQTNLLIISHNGKESGYRFNRDDTEFEIDLNKE